MQFEHRVAGIPCIINVLYYKWHKGQGRSAPSDWDAEDHLECDWEVCDRRGRLAPWLSKKLTPNMCQEVEQAIADQYSYYSDYS